MPNSLPGLATLLNRHPPGSFGLAAVEVRQNDKWYYLRTAFQGCTGKVLQAVGVKIPAPVRPKEKNVVPKDARPHATT
nr:hypothetical protein [Desulfobacca acetoxidans]